MAGYSKTSLAKKLGIKEGHRVALLGAPKGFAVPGLPEVELKTSLRGTKPFDVVVLFAKRQSVLAERFPKAQERLEQAGGLWVAWPKKSSGVATDLGDAVVRAHGLGTGLVDNKVCAIDETWSGLRFVVRVKNRTR
ncbi:MAG: DUF3052 domain-containing protein [Myxococcota bacterium]